MLKDASDRSPLPFTVLRRYPPASTCKVLGTKKLQESKILRSFVLSVIRTSHYLGKTKALQTKRGVKHMPHMSNTIFAPFFPLSERYEKNSHLLRPDGHLTCSMLILSSMFRHKVLVNQPLSLVKCHLTTTIIRSVNSSKDALKLL